MVKSPRGFDPIIDDDIEVLILGSFPSKKSLQADEYYAHKKNQFWYLVGEIVGEDMSREIAYEQRKKILLKHHIGVWDVIGACEREGSLDADIRNQRDNNFSGVLNRVTNLRCVCFNGKKAAQAEPVFREKYKTIVLPSSSPAYTLSIKLKCEKWLQIADAIDSSNSTSVTPVPIALPLI